MQAHALSRASGALNRNIHVASRLHFSPQSLVDLKVARFRVHADNGRNGPSPGSDSNAADTTTWLIGGSALAAGVALLVVSRESVADWLFYQSLYGDSGFGAGDIVGGLLWASSLWFCSPLQLLLLFLGKIDTDRPSDWVLRVLGVMTKQPVDAVDYEVPAYLNASAAVVFVATGMAVALLFSNGLGDSTWSISSGLGSCVAASVYEVGRPRRMSATEAQELESQWQDFAVFAKSQLQLGGRCHESEVFSAFRRSYPKYRQPGVVADTALRDMVRFYHPDVERTPKGFYKNLSLKPKVDGFTGQTTGTALAPATQQGSTLDPSQLLQGDTAEGQPQQGVETDSQTATQAAAIVSANS